MPFTLSHAAAVLPAVRRTGRARGPLLASALVLGSFAPDTFYFLDAIVQGVMGYGDFTHSLLGVVTADAALTVALAACWLLLREPLIALLPRAWQGRAYSFLRGEDWRAGRRGPALALRFYLSAVLGSLTHVVWDSFTHLDRWGTNALPALGKPLAFGLPLYSFLQYGSSALAACALLWFTVTGLRRLPVSPVPPSVPPAGRVEVWCAVALAVVCVGAGVTLRVMRYFTFFDRVRTPLDIIPTVCFGAGGGLIVALLLYGALVRLRHRGDGHSGDRYDGDRHDGDRHGDDGHDGDGHGDRYRGDEETRTPVPMA
ncbi:DUF4184 family protein [Streptomyces sp. A1136]|uniref:DUF4184 family protein n=1 Tax=Streptomyces sp. A1136 TaxID=2563102 RepID=UPI00109E9B12|nr:DUF4184 family protein [Streptomyces sp. A1136]THA46684.1 DUF4184 family protein [Streptomyces sp. A1136]